MAASMISSNRTKALEEIQALIERNQLSLLIGAGFSRNISKSFPMWRELLSDAVWNKYGSGRDVDRAKREKGVIDKVLRDKSLLDIASEVVAGAGYHEAIDDYIEAHTPYVAVSGDKLVLMKDGVELPDAVKTECHTLLRQLDVRNIYTFNYDNALEFFLGDKTALLEKREAFIKERDAEQERLKSIEDSLYNLRKEPPRESLSGDTVTLGLSEEDTLPGKNPKEQEEDLLKQRQESMSLLLDKKQKISAIDKDLENAYLVVTKSSDIALTSEGRNIYKIHGDLRRSQDTPYGFDGDTHVQYIITKDDYGTYEAKHAAFVNLMRIDLLRNRFCIMGVSGTDANFLAWINWVKDVLDKTGNDASEQRLSYFIHSGDRDLSREMMQMLRNHFILPVVLKDFFPSASDDTERIKAFLEFIQPNNTIRTEKMTRLWRDIDHSSLEWKNGKGVPNASDLEDLCRLSSSIVFHKADSIVHITAKDIQASPYHFTKKGVDLKHLKVFASAIRCSLMPFTSDLSMRNLAVLSKSRELFVKETYQYARRRHYLLTNPASLNGSKIGNDAYAGLLKRLFLFDFPAMDECTFPCVFGLDYVRLFSLQVLLSGESDVKLDDSLRRFSSPQELVLAADWTSWMDRASKTPLFLHAQQLRRKFPMFRLSDYIHSYLKEMREKKDVSTYGNVVEIVYMDGRTAGFENAAVLLNSLLELGVTYAGHTVLTDEDWISVIAELKSYYPYPIAFYTIARNSKDSVAKRVAQELMYDESSYLVMPDLLRRMMLSLAAKNTPEVLLAPIARFAKELFVAVPVAKWGKVFIQGAETCLDYADREANYPTAKVLYQFVAEGTEYINDKALKLRLLSRVLANLSEDSKLDNQLNALAISAGRGLTVKDFEPLAENLVKYAKKNARRIESYVLINLSDLLSLDNRRLIHITLERQALRDANLAEAYSVLIKDEPDLSTAFKKKLLARKDVWQSGVGDGHRIVGDGHIKISRIDEILHFDYDQVRAIYEDLRDTVASMKKVFQNRKRDAVDYGWMSEEGSYREIVMDMMLCVHHHEKELVGEEDYNNVVSDLRFVYSKCLFGKTILQMLADDQIYRAIRSMMIETELSGIHRLAPEYETLFSIMLTRDSKDTGICFQHVSWAVKEYEEFFNTDAFITLLLSVLDSYVPYFVEKGSRSWDSLGCEKETAEKHLVSLAKTLAKRGYPHSFWESYKKRYFLA